MTKGNQASHATNGRGDQRDLQILEQAEEYSHTDPLNQRGNRHNTYDDETYQRSDLPGGDPTARPREPVNLRPNKRWRAVYQIQAHMAQFREDPRNSGGRSE